MLNLLLADIGLWAEGNSSDACCQIMLTSGGSWPKDSSDDDASAYVQSIATGPHAARKASIAMTAW
jgi:hypothetical protein